MQPLPLFPLEDTDGRSHFFPVSVFEPLMLLISPFSLCPRLITNETPSYLQFVFPLYLWPPPPRVFPPCPTSLFFLFSIQFSPLLPWCFNSIMDVHKAQFTSRAFSIISAVNSLTVPASSPAHLSADTAGLSVCVQPA